MNAKTNKKPQPAEKSFDTLTLVERPVPTPGPGQALIRVHYAGIAARDQGIVTAMFPVPAGPNRFFSPGLCFSVRSSGRQRHGPLPLQGVVRNQ